MANFRFQEDCAPKSGNYVQTALKIAGCFLRVRQIGWSPSSALLCLPEIAK